MATDAPTALRPTGKETEQPDAFVRLFSAYILSEQSGQNGERSLSDLPQDLAPIEAARSGPGRTDRRATSVEALDWSSLTWQLQCDCSRSFGCHLLFSLSCVDN